MNWWVSFFIFLSVVAKPLTSHSQNVVGRKAAEKYFKQRNPDSDSDYQPMDSSDLGTRSLSGFEVLMLNIGSFVGSDSYFWGSSQYSNLGRANYGVTYLYDQWRGMDRNIRLEFSEYRLENQLPRKLSILPLITFPRAETKFPLYFGFGAGIGVIFNQLKGESDLSFDYQLVSGVRFLDIFDQVGFFVEFSMKNHLFILSDGQFNGTALNTGVVFTF